MDTSLNPAICLVAQVSNKGDKLRRFYEEIYKPAIAEAGLIADTLMLDGGTSAELISRVTAADICFADISEDDPLLWMVLGCALALERPLCLVAERGAADAASPAAARLPARLLSDVISYPRCLLPSDYAALRQGILDFLRRTAAGAPPHSASAPGQDSINRPAALSPADDPLASLSLHGQVLGSTSPQMHDKEPTLSSYEMIALALIAKDAGPDGVGVGRLAQNMHKFGLVQATSLAVNSLRRKHCVIRHEIPSEKHGITTDTAGLFATPTGLDWLRAHSSLVEQAFSNAAPAAEEPTDLIGLLAIWPF